MGPYDPQALRNLSTAERQEVLRELVDIERESEPEPGAGRGTIWKWDVMLATVVVACVVLGAWIGYLAVTLPHFYRTGSWRGAWVGLDVGELAAFIAVGLAAWRRRQLLVIALVVLATLLICDAWFDIVLDLHTSGFWGSVASAVLLELPLALIALVMARWMLHATVGQVMRYEGLEGPTPPLWRIPLFGPDDPQLGRNATTFQRLRSARARRKAARAEAAGGEAARDDGARDDGVTTT